MTARRRITDAELVAALLVPQGSRVPDDVLRMVSAATHAHPQVWRWRWQPRTTDRNRLASLILIAVLAVATLAAVAAGVGQSPTSVPRFAPGSIGFSMDGAVFVASPDTWDPVKVLDASTEQGSGFGMMAFAPDRQALAVVRYSDITVRDLTIVPADSNEPPSHYVWPEAIGKEPYWWGGWVPGFAWAPDGHSIAMPADSEPALTVLGRDGQPDSSIALPASFVWGSLMPATWSPDGQWIAALGCADPCDIKFDTRVLLVRADGSGSHWLSSDTGVNEWGAKLAWAADGRIALGEGADVLVTTTDGSVLRRTAMPGYVSGLAWSPDGTQLAVDRGDEVTVIDADGTTRDMTPAGTPIEWSPDGGSLLVTRGPASGFGSAIWTVPADGGTAHQLIRQVDGTFDIARGDAP